MRWPRNPCRGGDTRAQAPSRAGPPVSAFDEALSALEKGPAWKARPTERAATTAGRIAPIEDDGASELVTLCASDVRAKRVEWFAPGRIPFSAVTLFDGPGGIGKTTAILGTIATASVGRSFFDDSPIEPTTSIVVVEEDGLGVLKLRLQAAGANLNRVHFVTGVRTCDAIEPFALPRHVPELEREIQRTGTRFVYVDALFSHLEFDGDGRMPQQTRRALRPVVEMIARAGVAFAATRHWTKAAGPASARALGSAELSNVARSVLTFGSHPDDESRGIVAVTKHNLATMAPALAYRIEAVTMTDDDGNPCEVTKVTLDGEAPDVTADDLATRLPGDPDERGAAGDWLGDYLGDGKWHNAADVYKAARKDGAGSPATIRRAATRLGVERDRSGFPSSSTWRLQPDRSQIAHSQSVSELEQSGGQGGLQPTLVASLNVGPFVSERDRHHRQMVSARDLLAEAESSGARFRVVGDRLEATPKISDRDLHAAIGQRKDEIIALLRERDGGCATDAVLFAQGASKARTLRTRVGTLRVPLRPPRRSVPSMRRAVCRPLRNRREPPMKCPNCKARGVRR